MMMLYVVVGGGEKTKQAATAATLVRARGREFSFFACPDRQRLRTGGGGY